jgi:hypothetical protein
MLNQNSKITISEQKCTQSTIELSYGKLFENICWIKIQRISSTSYQDSFVNQIRWFIENKFFKNWESCSGANNLGVVTYYKVETNIFNTKEESKLYDIVEVDYYNGFIMPNNDDNNVQIIKLNLNLIT